MIKTCRNNNQNGDKNSNHVVLERIDGGGELVNFRNIHNSSRHFNIRLDSNYNIFFSVLKIKILM